MDQDLQLKHSVGISASNRTLEFFYWNGYTLDVEDWKGVTHCAAYDQLVQSALEE